MAQPVQKRVRTEEQEGDTPPADPPVRSLRVWYDDGNLIVQARNLRFKVHRGFLASKSDVFRDMLALPASATNELVEDCPVVQLTDDPISIEHTFRALYGDEHYAGRVQMHAHVLAAIFGIAKKYMISSLLRDTTDRLFSCYPTSFAQRNATLKNPKSLIDDRRLGSIFLLCNMAADHGIFPALPALYFECVVRSVSCTFLLSAAQDDSGAFVPLRPDLLLLLVKARELLRVSWSEEVFGWLSSDFPAAPGCYTRDQCESRRARLYRQLHESRTWMGSWVIGADGWDATWATGLCDTCSREAKTLFIQRSEDLWAKLPSYFPTSSLGRAPRVQARVWYLGWTLGLSAIHLAD